MTDHLYYYINNNVYNAHSITKPTPYLTVGIRLICTYLSLGFFFTVNAQYKQTKKSDF